MQILDENALLLVGKAEYGENGWESWCLLVQQYAPSGGAYELDSMMALMTVHQCKSLVELPGAVARFERDIDAYEKRTSQAFPPEFKVPAFLRMVPKSHASDMRWRFSQGATDYDTLKSSILTYTQHVRFENSYGKGDTDMQVDAFGYSKSDEWSDWLSVADPTEVTAFYEGVAAGLSSEIPDEPVHPDPTDQPLDALYRKGKGKGKAKNSFREKGKGKGYQGGDGVQQVAALHRRKI